MGVRLGVSVWGRI